MTTSLTQRFLADQSNTDQVSSLQSDAPRNSASSQLVSHLVNAYNSQISAETEIEKFRISSAAEVEKDKNRQHYTLVGSVIGVLGV